MSAVAFSAATAFCIVQTAASATSDHQMLRVADALHDISGQMRGTPGTPPPDGREVLQRRTLDREAARVRKLRIARERATQAARAAAPPVTTPVTSVTPVSAGSAQAIAEALLPSYGWSVSSQFGCLDDLWTRESGWNTYAENPYSGAYGIPQALPGDKMASAGADWQTNPRTQIIWGLGYIKDRYGTPCGAWANEENFGSYAVTAKPMFGSPGGGGGRNLKASRGLRAFEWAVAHERGCWYVWAGAGPCGNGYDCSGAVMRAFDAVGIYLPHNVAQMLGSGKLIRIPASEAVKGDLAIWGTEHVEFVAHLTTLTFGAHHTGTKVGFRSTWGSPEYYRVKGAARV